MQFNFKKLFLLDQSNRQDALDGVRGLALLVLALVMIYILFNQSAIRSVYKTSIFCSKK